MATVGVKGLIERERRSSVTEIVGQICCHNNMFIADLLTCVTFIEHEFLLISFLFK